MQGLPKQACYSVLREPRIVLEFPLLRVGNMCRRKRSDLSGFFEQKHASQDHHPLLERQERSGARNYIHGASFPAPFLNRSCKIRLSMSQLFLSNGSGGRAPILWREDMQYKATALW
jgi:hypothetical protein